MSSAKLIEFETGTVHAFSIGALGLGPTQTPPGHHFPAAGVGLQLWTASGKEWDFPFRRKLRNSGCLMTKLRFLSIERMLGLILLLAAANLGAAAEAKPKSPSTAQADAKAAAEEKKPAVRIMV